LSVDPAAGIARAGQFALREGDLVSVDGTRGAVYRGVIPVEQGRPATELSTVLGWADGLRRLGVFVNADTARDARTAIENGADGIGLCRTEHQFTGDRLALIQQVLRDRTDDRALAELVEIQRGDFRELFRATGSRPVTVRLLDAPTHEFLPDTREANPMLGVRGVRLALLDERLYPAQASALFSAWTDVAAEGIRPDLEIMIPLVSLPGELAQAAASVRAVAAGVPYRLGSMVETPRAALLAGELAETAEFLSFGTNDLTQLTYGFSRDDIERPLLAHYIELGLLPSSPFERLDEHGVGALIETAVRKARAARPDIRLGLCGEQGGDPASIALCDRWGLDYVSCSPHRIPAARLAAAQSAVRPTEGAAS
jgi:pyruvate,orthophosphate dikinase